MELKATQVPGAADHLSPEEARDLDELVPIRNFKKGTVLLEAGQVATESYYCMKGCVHLYYNVDGNERTTAFYTEGQSIASLKSFLNQVPADHFLACVEDCTLAVWAYAAEKELFRRHPRMESFCRFTVENDFGTAQEALASFITKTPEQRYLDLLTARPELVQRVPQYLLASYLGVTPESLSRIRKRIVGKAASMSSPTRRP